MARRLGNDTIVVIRAPLVQESRDGTWYRDWENAQETVVEGCSVQPMRLSDKLRFDVDDEREFHMTFLRIYAPAQTDIDYTDQIRFLGKHYTVQGEPTPWRRFSGNEHHLAFLVKLREG